MANKVIGKYIGYKFVETHRERDTKVYLFSGNVEIPETGLMNRFPFTKGVEYCIWYGRKLRTDDLDYPIRIKGGDKEYEVRPGFGIVDITDPEEAFPTGPIAFIKYCMKKEGVKVYVKKVRKR